MSPAAWWSNAVFYQVYPRSFADSNGDGVGDIDGLVAHLDHLERLGVDAIWLNPVTVSPMADHGYDVADPRDIDPLFGGMAAIERLIAEAHQRDIKITMDVVPNHTSSEHVWFLAALAAGPGTDARERYIFRDGRGPDRTLPPNNWTSVFGGSAWTREARSPTSAWSMSRQGTSASGRCRARRTIRRGPSLRRSSTGCGRRTMRRPASATSAMAPPSPRTR